MNKSARVLLLFPLIVNAGHAIENTNDDPFFFPQAPIVLSATRLKQPLSKAPAATTVIDKAMIKASGAKEITELFRLVPGMNVSYKRKHLPAVSYHGMGDEFARGMQVLVDGHSIYSASFGGLFWVDYPLLIEDIERIEIIRGPAAATFGPNAFLGVINIITTHTSQDQVSQANFRAGSNNYYRGTLRHGGQWKDLGYHFSFSHNEDDGLENLVDRQVISKFSSRFDYQLSNKDTLQYNFGYSEGKHSLGTENSLIDPSRYERGTGLAHSLRWEHQFSPNEQTTLQLTHNRHDMRTNFSSNGLPTNNNQLSERIDLEFQHTLSPYDNIRMVWGLGSRLDRMRLPLWTGDDDKSNVLYRIFSNIEWTFLDNFHVNAGALLEKNAYTHVDISPKISLNYLFLDQHNFRIMASKASRMPALGEQNLNVKQVIPTLISVRAQTNETLKPVEVITYEIGHHGQFFNQHFITDIKLAHQRFTRLVFLSVNPDNPTVLDYKSGDVATALNVEIQVDYKPQKNALLHMGYSWININHRGDRGNNYRESAPHHSANVLLAYEFPYQWQASLGYYYRDEMQYFRTTPIGSFQRLDLVLRKTIKLTRSQKLELSLIHQNNLGSKEEFEARNRLSDQTFFEISYQYD